MKKDQLEKEFTLVLEEANTLREQSELEFSTAEFLGRQTDVFIHLSKNETLTFDERETISKQMESLQGRIHNEIRHWNDGMVKLKKLEEKLEYLLTLPVEE